MKRVLSFLLAVLLVFSLAACQKKETAPLVEAPIEVEESATEKREEPPALQWETELPPLSFEPDWTVDSSSADFLAELCDPKYEGRVTGSAGNRAAAQWIKEQFAGFGLARLPGSDDYLQPFASDVFEVLPGFAALVEADGTETPLELGVDWCFTASYEVLDLTLPLSGNLEDCQAGRAFLDKAQTKQPHPRELIEVEVSDFEGNTPYFSASGAACASRVTVTAEVYERLTQPGAKLRLRLPQAAQEGEADNVIGYLPGKNGKNALVLGAHFDGSGFCGVPLPSAYDNASGVATLIQTAAWLSKAEGLPCDVIFAAFNGEEIGLLGSKAFAKQIEKSYEQILMLNIDCVGWQGESPVLYATDAQASLRNDVAAALGLPYKSMDYASDQSSFRKDNMRSVLISQEANYPGGSADDIAHGYHDVPENLDPASMDLLAKQLCSWVIERGDLPLRAYAVYW